MRSVYRLVSALAVTLLSGCATGNASNPPAAAPESALGSYLAAQHAQTMHDYGDAANLLERALAADPSNYDLVRHVFLLRVSEGRVDESVPLAQKIIGIDGNSGLPGMVVLEQALKAGKFDEAVKLAQSMPREGAQRFAVPLFLAWAQAGLHQFGPALQSLDGMNGVSGIAPLHDLHTALIEDYTDHVDEAKASFQRVLAGPQSPTWRVAELAGNFYERHGDAADAKQLYEKIDAQQGTIDVATAGLARIAKGTVPARVIATPADGAAEAMFDLAGLLNAPETMDAALIYARLALDLAPRFALAQMLVGEIRDAQERQADALALYQAVDPKSPYAWIARLRAALELDALDRTDEAVATLKALAAERPARSEPLIEEGDILRGHKRFAEAVGAYDEAAKRIANPQPDDWRIFYSRGVAEERSNNWPGAETDLKHALSLQPDQPLVLNYLGYSWIDKGENLERAIEILPADPTINDHLGDAYWRTGRQAEARYQWQRALQFQPEADEVKGIQGKLDHGLGALPSSASVNGG